MIGADTSDVISAILEASPEIESLNVFEYEHPSLIQERLQLTLDEQQLVSAAMELRAHTVMPFWEALLLTCFEKPTGYERIMSEALYHQHHRSSLSRISRQAVAAGQLKKCARVDYVNPQSLSSLVQVQGGKEMHLVLLDFHCPETHYNDRLVSQACRLLFSGKVFVLASGESYHAIGEYIVSWKVLQGLLTKSLLLAPIVDARYIAHQLLEHACALRIGSSGIKVRRPTVKMVLAG